VAEKQENNMSQQNESGLKAFTATSAVCAWLLVKLTAGSGTAMELNTVGAQPLGVAQKDAAAGEVVTVALRGHGRTFKCVACKAIAVGAAIYAAASGKVSDAAVGTAIGTALEVAAANNDVIECVLDNAGSISGLDGSYPANLASGGNSVPFIIRNDFADGATGDTAIYAAAAPFKFRVIDAWFENKGANGANANTVQLCAAAAGASPITDAMSTNALADKGIVRMATLDDATALVALGGDLYIRRTRAAGVLTGTLWILAVREA
jgi:hypothetical protein